MLKTVDILIGLAVVMLVVSMAVTLIVEVIVALLNMRGSALRRGLADLLRTLHPALPDRDSKDIATAVLKHPVISDNNRLGDVIQRDEFARLLLTLAAGQWPNAAAETAVKNAKKLLEENGIADPAQALDAIRQTAQSLEASNPGLAAHVRQDTAILQAAASSFVAKVNEWFDQLMDRVSKRFTLRARVVTMAAALAVALFLRLDTIDLINRLNTSDTLRQKLVDLGQSVSNAPTKGSVGQVQQLEQLNATVGNPCNFKGSWPFFDCKTQGSMGPQPNVVGMLLSACLLSLGAPFWFGVLKDLLQLRSQLARKEDVQREGRQAAQVSPTSPTPASSPPPAPSPLSSERGNLMAVG